jgi:hypothetical protein
MTEKFCGLTGKVMFDSPSLAHAVRKRDAKRTRGNRKRGQEVYRCDHCNAWHLGRMREHRLANQKPAPSSKGISP